MGSFEEATMTGFMCRLCSNFSKRVVHVFGMEHLSLVRKIAVTVEVKVCHVPDPPVAPRTHFHLFPDSPQR